MRAVFVIILGRNCDLLLREGFCRTVARPEHSGGRKLIERDFTRHGAADSDRAVVFEKSVTVAAVGEGNIQNLGVFERLLHAVADAVIVVLGFDDRNGQVWFAVKEVIRLLGLPAPDGFSPDDDTALSEISLFPDLSHQIPTGSL